MIARHLTASHTLIKARPVVKELTDLKSWPWIALAGFQFWSAMEITLFGRNGAEQTLGISPVLISERSHQYPPGSAGRSRCRRASRLIDSR
jgi:hypothetical protein